MWTFGRRLALGFAVPVLMLIGIGLVSHRATDALIKTNDWVTHTHVVLEHISQEPALLAELETTSRGFVISDDESFVAGSAELTANLQRNLTELRELTADNPEQQRRLDQLGPLVQRKIDHLLHLVDVRRHQGLEEAEHIVASKEGSELMGQVRRLCSEMERSERALLEKRAAESASTAESAKATIVNGTLMCLLLVIGVALLLTRSLSKQVGSAVKLIQVSSTELQAASNQQVTSAKEQATAMNEISTTISELLATSRQIAESAQRVAQIAGEAGSAARSGDQTLARAQDSVLAIKRQVDVIVGHMLDLGKKSQQIGSVLEIINELSEQTNILSINATIEAAGAGESGRRFAVVADEIRKLADRVGGSTKEIRGLVDDVRAAVNTTVMATEVGSKAVDAGATQFTEVATAFRQISGSVMTMSDAAREIELSTKQQATAVEQVNVAVANVSQATKETESSSSQTLQTASQLTLLSRELTRLIQPDQTA